MPIENLTPIVRTEQILDGEDIAPANRLEYFLSKAANVVPKPAAADAGKFVVVNETGTGYELVEVPPANGEDF